MLDWSRCTILTTNEASAYKHKSSWFGVSQSECIIICFCDIIDLFLAPRGEAWQVLEPVNEVEKQVMVVDQLLSSAEGNTSWDE